jgi:serine O-acetyltransferase
VQEKEAGGSSSARPGLLKLIRSDAARWVIPSGHHDPDKVTFGQIVKFYYRYVGFRAAVWYRIGHWCYGRRVRGLPSLIQHRIHFRYGLEVVISMPIGEGLYIAHTTGMVLAAKGIGSQCSLIGGITLGMRNTWQFPVLGDNVFVGAGARILGGITVGDNAVIGANAVVIQDIAPGDTVVGIPARPVRRKESAPATPAAGNETGSAVPPQ